MSQNTQNSKSPKLSKSQTRLSIAEKKTIVAQLEEGVTQKSLSEQYGVSTAAIQEWVNKYASEVYLNSRQKKT